MAKTKKADKYDGDNQGSNPRSALFIGMEQKKVFQMGVSQFRLIVPEILCL